ncbi:MAG: ABC transporter ATP-binding protein [Roseburia sp.]|uniref:ABC transporter ATP-binding protein n=1 Tax=Roseburia sp. 831b TaxID=1261635 RepID=UPI0009519219|nr:ABC transporter ATP-binding protein [Roseburia sp. 831b]MCI5919160.1 ABC transporter ATP-binding protein [Roseburia sp.]MDY5883057.1 ABC transporter ATP-binding protein [Roseburia sp.]WVK74566.1 ABC transporter ATP-binding protein [Roseburia sp. 831b]
MIEMKNVQKSYGAYHLDLSMEIPDGRITGLVGKNGAGKSTVIKLLLGLVKPDAGSIFVLDKSEETLTPEKKQQIGVSMAEAGFSSQLNINDIEHILAKMYPKFERSYFKQKCQELALPTNKRIQEFSTGMKAKLRVLTAMTHKAKLLILDEPTAGLDIEARNEILDMLREYVMADEERTVLITSHISSDLENLCDDIYMIHDGKIILHEDTDIITEQYGVLKVKEQQYRELDKDFILSTKKENYGYACFVSDKNFYKENYPEIVVENGGIDELILMMTGGKREWQD